MGHSELDCPKPSERDANGKWEYDNRIRAPEEKKKRVLSFAQAATVWDGAPNRSESHSSSKTRSSEEFSSQKSERRKTMVYEAHTSFFSKKGHIPV